jgi:hypothetical protein
MTQERSIYQNVDTLSTFPTNKLTSMWFRVWVLDIQNPKNRTFFRKILNSNLNNFFVLTDRRTFYL